MKIAELFERLVVAVFGGLFAGLVVLFLTGCLWFMGMAVDGSGMSIAISKVLLLYIPVACAALFAVCALFAPDRTADYFGGLVQKVFRGIKNTWSEWPH